MWRRNAVRFDTQKDSLPSTSVVKRQVTSKASKILMIQIKLTRNKEPSTFPQIIWLFPGNTDLHKGFIKDRPNIYLHVMQETDVDVSRIRIRTVGVGGEHADHRAVMVRPQLVWPDYLASKRPKLDKNRPNRENLQKRFEKLPKQLLPRLKGV